MTDLLALREQVAIGCRILAHQGLAHEIAGHVSARIPGTETMAIRARSARERGVRFTKTDAIRVARFDGEGFEDPEYELPLELPIHGQILAQREDVNAVVHAHPTYTVLCSVAGIDLAPVYGAYNSGGLRLALAGIPTYPSSRLVDDIESGNDLVAAMDGRRVCIMRGHGIAAAGKDVPEAVLAALRVERLAFFIWQMKLAGVDPTSISQEEIDFFTRPYKREMGADGPWRWISYVADEEADSPDDRP